jgi:hypothetical protein
MVELNSQKMEDLKGRYKYYLIVLGAAFFLLSAHLWYLQTFEEVNSAGSLRITAFGFGRILRTGVSCWIEKAVFWPKTGPASRSILSRKI